MDRFLKPHYEKLHEALGDLVREWAWLEEGVVHLIFDLAAVGSRSFYEDQNVAAFCTIVASNIDLRTSINIAKALAFSVREEIGNFEQIEKTLNEINNDLRNERNRFVHDQWMVSYSDRIVRFRKGTRIPRQPGSGERKLELSSAERYGSINHIQRLAVRVREVRSLLNDFSEICQEAYRQKFPDEESP